MAKTAAQKNRAIRQGELREYLAARGGVSYVLDNIEIIEELDVTSDTFDKELTKRKVANEQRIRLLNKYLPDIKEEHIINDEATPIVVNIVKPDGVD
tara:strand:+ start:1545 stop:1835 length:291 start_codon:yes stop_codon:yes gene_type:complete